MIERAREAVVVEVTQDAIMLRLRRRRGALAEEGQSGAARGHPVPGLRLPADAIRGSRSAIEPHRIGHSRRVGYRCRKARVATQPTDPSHRTYPENRTELLAPPSAAPGHRGVLCGALSAVSLCARELEAPVSLRSTSFARRQ